MHGSLALTFLGSAAAFPHMAAKMMMDNKMSGEELAKRQTLSYTGFPTTEFNAQAQFVSNSGSHAFQAPRNLGQPGGDIRGPCPGLNAAANHGYISRDGVTNLVEAIQGTNAVFGMGLDLGGFLSAYSVLQVGDPLTQKWSIGGAPPATLGNLVGIKPQGLTGSHNRYETDSSPMRGDLYQFNGNNFGLQLSQFKEFYNYHAGEENPNYTFEDLVKFRSARFTESIQKNPYFFYGPFTGAQVSQAAFTFISAFMSNHSAEYPNGFLSRSTLQSFMSVTGTPDNNGANLKFVPGNERIPDNWYKRAISNPYSITAFTLDALRIFAADPRILSVGGNTGTVNSYVGLDLTNATNGLYNAGTLAQGNNAACYLYQAAQLPFADSLKTLTGPLLSAVNAISNQYLKAPVACPQLQQFDKSFTNQFPGASL
ncbi:Chloroperoxidase [Protomyces lactucae-debilis]|uniref:Chloroperoxidase n=1 Tax=Protomyces lactucae-debilis TaxID=2754530 RepID=A0A1Y2FSL2_PROLT|nr:Chloroperoxidase [Protomyces lactucae-debilis]ORY86991.1 Chloroperoxidase [Protomyces lactucae-debilis]